MTPQSAIVTGAGSGLGRATTEKLAVEGYRVYALDRSEDAVRSLATEADGDVIAVTADVSDEDSLNEAFTIIERSDRPFAVCVNAAGIAPGATTLRKGVPMAMDDFRKTFDINVFGTFDVTRRAAALMARADADTHGRRGVIINVSSGAAWQGQRGQAAYAASKAAIDGLSLPVARDLARDGIRVVAIAPGLFDTGISAGFSPELVSELERSILNPSRLGDPQEFAALVCHIIDNPYLNATTISLDAGARMV